uniref:Uncharacterized protein n=1 Tax=Anguilla anguilla TaxID=7936 RepID=A0A0E9UUY1_ANGAN
MHYLLLYYLVALILGDLQTCRVTVVMQVE